ncbi:hypothetical protein NHX12_023445 [Muraenolepis orangiensis]|uniref:Uncharacterized protein n=1 Tax=Muraenolepis orangiensis TaxID=630683 RepID=A0A9Q0EJG3_9TELE|nr:hypothetical protein NHX12_023445 [Muraenolepis orangiensis]
MCNTYLLPLDGNTDFLPPAAMLLMDRLKQYPGVGATCGRIHPTGSGFLVEEDTVFSSLFSGTFPTVSPLAEPKDTMLTGPGPQNTIVEDSHSPQSSVKSYTHVEARRLLGYMFSR